MKVALAADTHGMWKEIDYPPADFLIFAGDIVGNYAYSHGDNFEIDLQLKELVAFNRFCKELKKKYKEIFFVAGNHGWCFQRSNKLARECLTNVVYLQDSFANVGTPKGSIIKIYGSPWQPWFYNWAFNFPDHNANFFRAKAHAKACWGQIPNDTQILITHGPPYKILDEAPGGRHVGCEWLKEKLKSLMQLKLHVFGHIHCAYGQRKISNTFFANASVCNEGYKPVNPIQVIALKE